MKKLHLIILTGILILANYSCTPPSVADDEEVYKNIQGCCDDDEPILPPPPPPPGGN